MSVSTDGILFFGFTFHEEDADSENLSTKPAWFEIDWEEFYVTKKGLTKPSEKYPPNRDPELEAAWDKYYTAKRDMLKAEPCTVAFHGGEGCWALFVTVKGGYLRASRGYPKKVTMFTGSPSWFEQIKTFCQIMEIDFQEPAWYLASYWG